MSDEDELRAAFEVANAIGALEGWEPTAYALEIQERVIKGELTVDEAVQAYVAHALAQTSN